MWPFNINAGNCAQARKETEKKKKKREVTFKFIEGNI